MYVRLTESFERNCLILTHTPWINHAGLEKFVDVAEREES